MGSSCLQECHKNPHCFAWQENGEGDCTLYPKTLFTTHGELKPSVDDKLFLTKCFLPEPLCDPATDEVRRVNPSTTTDYHMDADTDTAVFTVTPASYTLTAAINACHLNHHRPGGCIGFAIEPATGPDGDRVTLLYNDVDGTQPFRADLADNPKVYDITGCAQ